MKHKRALLAIGRVTFLEILRDKILYNVLLFAVLLFGLGVLASNLISTQQARVMIDFGISALSLSCSMIAIFCGAHLLGKELNQRTIYVVLAHPISRFQFLVGKFVGLILILALNWFLLSLVLMALLSLVDAQLTSTLLSSLILIFIQAAILGSIALFFSIFSTAVLSIVMSLGFYLIGNSLSQLQWLASQINSSYARWALKIVSILLPNLEYFNLGTQVTYGLPLKVAYVVGSVAYGCTIIALALFFSKLFLDKREI